MSTNYTLTVGIIGKRIMRKLLVEDDHCLNQSLKMGMVEEGYEVNVAFDREENSH